MRTETLQKAKTLEIQIDECQRTYNRLKEVGAMRYITFEPMSEGAPIPLRISGHLKHDLVNSLMPLILYQIKVLESKYKKELEEL